MDTKFENQLIKDLLRNDHTIPDDKTKLVLQSFKIVAEDFIAATNSTEKLKINNP